MKKGTREGLPKINTPLRGVHQDFQPVIFIFALLSFLIIVFVHILFHIFFYFIALIIITRRLPSTCTCTCTHGLGAV